MKKFGYWLISNVAYFMMYSYSLTPWKGLGLASKSEQMLLCAKLAIIALAIQALLAIFLFGLHALHTRKVILISSLLYISTFVGLPLLQVYTLNMPSIKIEALNVIVLILWFKHLSTYKS